MKNETTLKTEKESSPHKQDPILFSSSNNFKNNPLNKNKESILFRNVDIKMDIFNTHLERDIKRLPANLRFIKKYLYLEFLTKIDKLIDELEKIKMTSNYDEKAIQIKPLQITKTPAISCCDLFDNHSIKHMRSNKAIYGTLNGNIIICDFEMNKNLNEKFLGNKTRVEIISTSTIKVYDSLISRIAVNFRGDPNITILSYNHTYNTFNSECVISLKDIYANFTMDPSSIALNTLPCGIKFSKDTYFMTVFDYLGGIRVYKFNEIPQSPAIMDSRPQKKESTLGFNFLMGKSNNLEKKLNALDPGFSNNLSAGQNASLNGQINLLNANSNNVAISATCIGYYKVKEIENFTILALNNKNLTLNAEAADKNKAVKNPAAAAASKKDDPKAKKPNNDKGQLNTEVPADEPGCYVTKALFDDNNLDLTPLIKLSKNNPDVVFVQKKLILDEKINGGFSTCTVTVGIYLSFYGSTQFKYISLYPYLTDNMKSVFKVTKSKGAGVISQEESMSIASSMAKKEKEYLNFLKSKLEPMINTVNNANNSNLNLNNISGQIVPNNPSVTKDAKDQKDAKPAASSAVPAANASNIQNPLFAENTKSEFNFNTLVNISHMCGQNQISPKTNLVAIGMVDGSVLIWDTELHCDKYLFQDNKNEILSMTMNSNFLTTAAKDGQVFIFDLVKGCRVFNCYHNPYKNFPVFYTGSFFSFMNLAIDTENKICVYNSKEAHKIAKLVLENSNKRYKVAYFNRHLLSCTQDYIVLICEKDVEKKEKLNLIDLIKFQNQPLKPMLEEYSENDLEFINYYQNLYSEEMKNKKNYIITFRIKEVLLKCYPQLIMANKKGMSLNKIMAKYTMNNMPSFETKDNFNYFFGNLKKGSLQDTDANFNINNNNNRKNKKVFPTLKSVKENELDSIEDIDMKRLGTDPDSLDKDSLTRKNSAMNENTQPSLKNLMNPETPISNLKPGHMLNLDDLQNMNNNNNINIINNECVPQGKEEDIVSSQKKNIFYLAFKNIKDRYQYREQRTNKIKMRSEEIMKEFKFPTGASSSKPKKDQFFSMKLESIRSNGSNKPFLNTKFS